MPEGIDKNTLSRMETMVADHIADRITASGTGGMVISSCVAIMLDDIHDNVGDTYGLAGPLAAAMLASLSSARIAADVERRFSI